jgi:hypothetical protein
VGHAVRIENNINTIESLVGIGLGVDGEILLKCIPRE